MPPVPVAMAVTPIIVSILEAKRADSSQRSVWWQTMCSSQLAIVGSVDIDDRRSRSLICRGLCVMAPTIAGAAAGCTGEANHRLENADRAHYAADHTLAKE
jgi:hypothetical protein